MNRPTKGHVTHAVTPYLLWRYWLFGGWQDEEAFLRLSAFIPHLDPPRWDFSMPDSSQNVKIHHLFLSFLAFSTVQLRQMWPTHFWNGRCKPNWVTDACASLSTAWPKMNYSCLTPYPSKGEGGCSVPHWGRRADRTPWWQRRWWAASEQFGSSSAGTQRWPAGFPELGPPRAPLLAPRTHRPSLKTSGKLTHAHKHTPPSQTMKRAAMQRNVFLMYFTQCFVRFILRTPAPGVE